ncbi:MAG TPA: hypothetical protein PKA63_01230 [Oligoflexia bacterium]|nr:hypothetical protein [Oligoflexia bacterium]HMP47272.1 hypothetical protein [Oligoflexia bacterium]
MIRLYLDTSSLSTLFLGLESIEVIGPEVISFPLKEGLLECLPEKVREACGLLGSRASEISEIILNLGPGSYTGLRSGITFSNGLSFATGAKIYGFSSFLIRGYSILALSGNNLPVEAVAGLKANKTELFVCNFRLLADTKTFPYELSEIYTIPEGSGSDSINRNEIYRIDEDLMPERIIPAMADFFHQFGGLLNSPDPGQSVKVFNRHARNWRFGESPSAEPLYIKNVAAKTLKERGINIS